MTKQAFEGSLFFGTRSVDLLGQRFADRFAFGLSRHLIAACVPSQ